MPRCGCVEHGYEYTTLYVQKHIAHLVACFGPPLVRDRPLGAQAFMKLASSGSCSRAWHNHKFAPNFCCCYCCCCSCCCFVYFHFPNIIPGQMNSGGCSSACHKHKFSHDCCCCFVLSRFFLNIIPDETKTISVISKHDDVIKWKHFPRYWPFVRGIHRSPVNSPHKASDAELWCLLWSVPEQTVAQTIDMPVIWDAIALITTPL